MLKKALICAVILLWLTGCAPTGASKLGSMAKSGFDQPAKNICTTTGSTPIPVGGKDQLVAAVNSTVGSASELVQKSYAPSYDANIGKFAASTKVAICFVELQKSIAPPNGRVVIVQLPDEQGSAIVASW